MKRARHMVVIFLTFVLLATSIGRVKAEVDVNFNLFFGQLSPYGSWVTVPSFGLVWYPSHHPHHWRPYLYGRWIWTEDGWTWVSYEPWGWATYHYGRWAYDPAYGWLWIPGSVWAPAWVAWYEAPDYWGWAPLGPTATIQIEPTLAVFVSFGSFLNPNLSYVAIDPLENEAVFHHHHFRFFENLAVVNGRVVDPGPNISNVERATGHSVQRFTLASRNVDPSQIRKLGSHVDELRGNHFYALRPHVSAIKNRGTPFLKNEAQKGAIIGNKPLAQNHTASRKGRTVLSRARMSHTTHENSLRSHHAANLRLHPAVPTHQNIRRSQGGSLATHKQNFRSVHQYSRSQQPYHQQPIQRIRNTRTTVHASSPTSHRSAPQSRQPAPQRNTPAQRQGPSPSSHEPPPPRNEAPHDRGHAPSNSGDEKSEKHHD